jgi:hypothetical protein
MGKVESAPWTLVGRNGLISGERGGAAMRKASGRESIPGSWSIEKPRSRCEWSRA